MNRTPLFFAALISNLMVASACAAVVDEVNAGIVEEKVRTLAPNAKTIAVSETPIDGLLQVQINSDIVYVTGDGQYLVQGEIMDIDTRVNITDQAKSGIRVNLLEDLQHGFPDCL